MSKWSTDMSAAPKGLYAEQTVTIKGKEVKRSVFEPSYVWVAGQKGGHVTRSQWLPEPCRWEMFTADNPPVAWRSYDPDEFKTIDADGKVRRAMPEYPRELLEQSQ